MPPSNKRALTARLSNFADAGAVRKPELPVPSAQPDHDSSELPAAEAIFRRCAEQGWNHSAWRSWFDWAKSISELTGGDWFKSGKPIDAKYTVHRYGKNDDILCYDYGDEFGRDRALEILRELGQQDILENFETFWKTIHFCLQYPYLTAAALRVDTEFYGGHFDLKERCSQAKELLRKRGLL